MIRKRIKYLLVGAISFMLSASFHALAQATTFPGSCREVTRAVSAAAGRPRIYTIAGTLCTPTAWAPGTHTLDILVPGGMYNRTYWSWPQNPSQYSYVYRTLQAGRATFNYDRLGTGRSSHPFSAEVTFSSDVYQLHDLISWQRINYPRINVIGHSLGSVIAMQEAGVYKGADRVVLTGMTHGHGQGFLTLGTAIYPANLDPQFSSVIPLTDPDYLTTLPGKRSLFFYSAIADPAVIAYDEAHKDMMTTTVASEAITAHSAPVALNISNSITAPVLMVVGRLDYPFCNVDMSCASDSLVKAFETPYFTSAKSFTAKTIPDTGHNLPLHPTAGSSFNAINLWLKTVQ